MSDAGAQPDDACARLGARFDRGDAHHSDLALTIQTASTQQEYSVLRMEGASLEIHIMEYPLGS